MHSTAWRHPPDLILWQDLDVCLRSGPEMPRNTWNDKVLENIWIIFEFVLNRHMINVSNFEQVWHFGVRWGCWFSTSRHTIQISDLRCLFFKVLKFAGANWSGFDLYVWCSQNFFSRCLSLQVQIRADFQFWCLMSTKFPFQVLKFASVNWSRCLILMFDLKKKSFPGAEVHKCKLEQIFNFDVWFQQVSFLGAQVCNCKLEQIFDFSVLKISFQGAQVHTYKLKQRW